MHADFQLYNPKRTATWRFDRVTELLGDETKLPSPRRDDRWVRDAYKFLRLLQKEETEAGQQALFPKNPGLFYAYLIYQDEDRDQRRWLEARLLAQQTDYEIAEAVKTLPAAVEWYEALFFNVRDRIQSRDWILKQILGPAIDRMMDDKAEELTMKMFAYYMGPIMFEAVLTNGFTGIAHVGDDLDVDAAMDHRTARSVRVRAMTSIRTAEINRFNIMELVGAQQRLIEMAAAAKEGELAQNAVEENIKGMMNEIPWLVGIGEAAKTAIGVTPLGKYEEYAAELRADEMLAIASGQEVPGIDGIELKKLPDPRPTDDANAQQGS